MSGLSVSGLSERPQRAASESGVSELRQSTTVLSTFLLPRVTHLAGVGPGGAEPLRLCLGQHRRGHLGESRAPSRAARTQQAECGKTEQERMKQGTRKAGRREDAYE